MTWLPARLARCSRFAPCKHETVSAHRHRVALHPARHRRAVPAGAAGNSFSRDRAADSEPGVLVGAQPAGAVRAAFPGGQQESDPGVAPDASQDETGLAASRELVISCQLSVISCQRSVVSTEGTVVKTQEQL